MKTIFHPRSFGGVIRRKRQRKNLTIEQAAEELGCTPEQWQAMEEGTLTIDVNMYFLLEKWAGISFFEVCEYINFNSNQQ